jgi:hypothetical protein
MKNKAFALVEQILVIIIIGILGVVILNVLRPNDIKIETLKKVSKSVYIQLEFATRNLLARNTRNYTFLKLRDESGEFSIASSASLSRFLELYKKNLVAKRLKTIDSTYASKELTDGITTYIDLKIEGFSGFFLKNGTYFAIKLHGNCTTTVDFIYDPSAPEKRIQTNTCGLMFFDINAQEAPNMLGVDQYILALGKLGIK